MTQDDRPSLLAFGALTLVTELSLASLYLLMEVNIPGRVLPFGLVLILIDLACRFLRWGRTKRIASREDLA